MKTQLQIDTRNLPNVLLLGNGVLRLNGGGDWGKLLQSIGTSSLREKDLEGVPYAMRPECVCGTDVEEVQRRTAEALTGGEAHLLLKTLLRLPFDAVLTTNYTYEIEEAISGKDWSDGKQRKKAYTALDGNTHVRHNTFACNMVFREDGSAIPVFHIHGEKQRKHSLVLSYYSYANAVSRLITLNKQRGNSYQEHQQEGKPLPVLSWLDYFIMGNVYAVGLGFDTSEFDLWWAAERKARENAAHGKLRAYITEKSDIHLPQEILLEAMRAELRRFPPDPEKGFEAAYDMIIEDLKREVYDNV